MNIDREELDKIVREVLNITKGKQIDREELDKIIEEILLDPSFSLLKKEEEEEGDIEMPDIEEIVENFDYPEIDVEQIKKYTKKRESGSYPKTINKEIRMITFIPQKNDLTGEYVYAHPYGSIAYSFSKYPGDIDLSEEDFIGLSREKVIKKFAGAVKKIANRINKSKLHYFVEFKAGIDNRYDVDIGDLRDGIYDMNRSLIKLIHDYYELGLFNDEEYYDILLENYDKYTKGERTAVVYDNINNVFRERKILRWTLKDINNGFIKRGDIKISLEKALSEEGHIKIDEIVLINGNFMEVTNFVLLGYIDDDGKVIGINMDPYSYINDLPYGLRRNIEETMFSHLKFSPFKVAKRIFALSRLLYLNGDQNAAQYIAKIVPILQSDVGIMYQAKSQLEAVLRIYYNSSKKMPISAVNKQLDNIKFNLSNVYELLKEDINNFNSAIDNAIKNKKIDEKIVLIEKILNHLKFIINAITIHYFDANGLNPLPQYLLPNQMMYKNIKIVIN